MLIGKTKLKKSHIKEARGGERVGAIELVMVEQGIYARVGDVVFIFNQKTNTYEYQLRPKAKTINTQQLEAMKCQYNAIILIEREANPYLHAV